MPAAEWPAGAPVGEHWSVTEALPRLLALLDEVELKATFFVEGRNAELYPDAPRELHGAGHEVAFHGWRHEPWGGLEPAESASCSSGGSSTSTRSGCARSASGRRAAS